MNRRDFVVSSAVWPLFAGRTLASESKPESRTGKNFWQGSCAHNTAEEVTAAGIDLTGKTALLTGSNAGIGFETLRVLVLRGAHVYALARNIEKAERACSAVTGTSIKGTATPFACEQADFSSVVACADAVQAKGVPIDMLICNAGIYNAPHLELAQGVEKQFAVNHLSHFILVNRLVDLVKAAPQGRVVVVGSAIPNNDSIEFDNLSGQRSYNSDKMYEQSKAANALFAGALARRLTGTRATANVLSPGFVLTESTFQWMADHHMDLKQVPGAKTIEQGAATICYVATSPSLTHVSGAFFDECKVVTSVGHDALAEKVWLVSEQLTHAYLPNGA